MGKSGLKLSKNSKKQQTKMSKIQLKNKRKIHKILQGKWQKKEKMAEIDRKIEKKYRKIIKNAQENGEKWTKIL